MVWTLFSKLYSDCSHWYQLCFKCIYKDEPEVFSCQDVRNFVLLWRKKKHCWIPHILWPDSEEYLLALIGHNVDIWTEEAMDINYVTHTEWYFWILAWSCFTIRETLLPFIVSTLRPLPVNKLKEIYSTTNSCVHVDTNNWQGRHT